MASIEAGLIDRAPLICARGVGVKRARGFFSFLDSGGGFGVVIVDWENVILGMRG